MNYRFHTDLVSEEDEEFRVIKDEQEYEYRKRMHEGQMSAVFKSNKPRECFESEVKQKSELPAGFYDISQNDIGTRLKRQN